MTVSKRLIINVTCDLLKCRCFLSIGLEEARDNVVSDVSIDQPSAIIMNEPAGNIFSILRVFSVVFLPAPVNTSHKETESASVGAETVEPAMKETWFAFVVYCT